MWFFKKKFVDDKKKPQDGEIALWFASSEGDLAAVNRLLDYKQIDVSVQNNISRIILIALHPSSILFLYIII